MSETTVSTEVQSEVTDDLDAFSVDFFGQNKQETEPASPEAEQEPTEELEGAETEPQTPAPDPDKPAEKPKPTVQDRIDELVRQRHQAERDGEAKLKALRDEMEAKIAALNPKAPEVKSGGPGPLDTNADGTDKYPLGEFDPTYIRDLTRFELETQFSLRQKQEEAEVQQREQVAQQTTLQSSWNEKLTSATERYPDLVEKSQKLVDGFSGLDQGYAAYISNVLMSMDHGPDVLHYLASNPEEAAKIVNSGAQKATLALGRIEAKFVDAEAAKKLAKPIVSKAPPPAPVQNRGTSPARLSTPGDTDDLSAFEKEFFKKQKKVF